jgi:ATP-dependent protease ClpP protease subunit
MIGHVYIEGQIGTSYKEDGSVDVRGVELQDVISQVRKNALCEVIHCHITSQGGLVDVGRKISEYFNSLPNLLTIAEVQCASIATEIHLSVPIERRQITAGTSYLIHQPMFSLQRGISLNSSELAEMASEIGKTQSEMVAMYAKATGMDKVSLELLMKQETALTPEQCKEFGFVSQIITSPMRAVALLTPKKEDMSNLSIEIKALRLQIAQFIAGQPLKKVALDLTTTDGTAVIVVTDSDMPAVGDAVTLADGTPAPDGTHEFEMGQIVTVGGVITEIVPVEIEGEDEAMVALKNENDLLKAEKAENEIALDALKTDFVAMAKLQSTYKPKVAAVAFRKQTSAPSDIDGYNAIKEAHEARKNKQAKK